MRLGGNEHFDTFILQRLQYTAVKKRINSEQISPGDVKCDDIQ